MEKIILKSETYGEHTLIVDKDDLPLINKLTKIGLSYNKPTKCFYAVYQKWFNNTGKTFKLHRIIMNAPKDLEVDHINHNTLDNRKCNLRLVTKAENAQNKIKAQSNNKTSGLRGVSYKKDRDKWKAYLTLNKKQIHLGYFKDIKDAEIAAINGRKKYFPFSQEALPSNNLPL